MRPTINSRKHIVQQSIDTTASGVSETVVLATAIKPGDVDINNEVVAGAVIKAIYIEMWLRGNDAGVGSSFVYILEKGSTTQASPTAGQMAALDLYANKKNILYTTQGLSNALEGVATPILKGWIKVPKSKQRFGLGDQLRSTIFSQSGASLRCGLAIYKEYY